jgi:SAM-dependent methyltransferase
VAPGLDTPVSREPYYRTDLAWVHHAGFAGHVQNTQHGIVARLREHGVRNGQTVLDVGCGTGLLARVLLTEGYAVHGIDASPAMIDFARGYAPGGQFEVRRLPTMRPAGEDAGLPRVDAVVSTGHVLNYLESREDVALALAELAGALRSGGLLAIDLMTERFCEARDIRHPYAKIEEDWAMITRYSRPGPHRFDRAITVFRRVDGAWRRSDEHHSNVTFEVDAALSILREHGVEARCLPAFGDETLPDGLVVLAGVKL